jgi:hypothetical protein
MLRQVYQDPTFETQIINTQVNKQQSITEQKRQEIVVLQGQNSVITSTSSVIIQDTISKSKQKIIEYTSKKKSEGDLLRLNANVNNIKS